VKRDVFVSYSSKDASVANALVHCLEEHGIRCWIAPRDIVGGREYADVIVDAIASARLVVVIFSDAAQLSQWVRSELNCAMSNGRTIVPVKIDDVLPTGAMQLYLGDRHWIDIWPEPDKNFGKVVDSVSNLLIRTELEDPCVESVEYVGTRLVRARWRSLMRLAVVSLAVVAGVSVFLSIRDGDRSERSGEVARWNRRKICTPEERETVRSYLKSLDRMLNYAVQLHASCRSSLQIVDKFVSSQGQDSPANVELLSTAAHTIVEQFQSGVEATDSPEFGEELQAFCALIDNPAEKMGPMGIQDYLTKSKFAWENNLRQIERALDVSSKLTMEEKGRLVDSSLKMLDECAAGYCIWTMRALVAFDQEDADFISFKNGLAKFNGMLPFSQMPFYEDAQQCESAWATGLMKTTAAFQRMQRLLAKAGLPVQNMK